jgi:transcriptional regulator with XRE-family HTH domain
MGSLKDCGARIRRARHLAGMSARQVAEALGFAEATVLRWEWGLRTPSGRTCEAISKLLGVPASWILFGVRELSAAERRQCLLMERAAAAGGTP